MAIPTYDQLIFPLMKVLAANPNGLKTKDVYEAVAGDVGLSDEDRRELLPSRRQPIYRNRISWAHDRLKRAGYSHSAIRGTWQLTPKGITFFKEHPQGLSDAEIEALAKVPNDSTVEQGDGQLPQSESISYVESPDERIDSAAKEINESLSAELLEAIATVTPIRFEQMVLDVLHAMGYGATRADLKETTASGDGGIDGIITLDRLGLEKVYVQAKRWKTDSTVGRPEIQKFVGALAGQGGTRGVFITTSTYSNEAREYTKQVPNSLVLIDGKELASLMIEYEIGVSIQRTIKIARLDSDYFEES